MPTSSYGDVAHNVSKKRLLAYVLVCKQCLCYKSQLKNKGHNNTTPTIQVGDCLQFMFEVFAKYS